MRFTSTIIVFLIVSSTYSQSNFPLESNDEINYFVHLKLKAIPVQLSFSPWGNFVFCMKAFPNSSPWDSIQFTIFQVKDTTKSIHLLTLFPNNSDPLFWATIGFMGSGENAWSVFQDKVFFSVRGSTINKNSYSSTIYSEDYEVFSINISSLCFANIPDLVFPNITLNQLNKVSNIQLQNSLTTSIIPNPLKSEVAIKYNLPIDSYTSIAIFNCKGELIKLITRGFQKAGTYITYWNGKNNIGSRVAKGEYFCQTIAGDIISTKKIIKIE